MRLVNPITNFDPLSPSNLRDPIFKDMNTDSRWKMIEAIHYRRYMPIVLRKWSPLNAAVHTRS